VWWALPLLTTAWLLMVLILAASLSRVQLWELAPGGAEAVAPRMQFGDDVAKFATVYESGGEVMFVTALGSQLTLLDVTAAWLDDDVDILTFEERFGTRTPSEQRASNARAMLSSKQIAEFVAFSRLGIESEFLFGDIIVDEVVCEDSPDPRSACLLLAPGDTIVAVDGKPTPTLPALLDAVTGKQPGDLAQVGIRREGSDTEETVTIKLISAPDGSGRTIVGLLPRDTRTVETPFEVGIDTDSIGGPSAGLAFTLALIDELSKGSLTGGNRVAVTGTIDGDETVGAVGAIAQKAVAARDSGAKLLLIPASQSPDDIAAARRIGGSRMRVETVATLQEALDMLRSVGGDPLLNSTNDE
jgi:Lon-like protease